MSKNEFSKRIRKIEREIKPKIESETEKLLEEYDLALAEFHKLPLDEQRRLDQLENAEFIVWYSNYLKGGTK